MTVIAAHRETHFRFLQTSRPGDEMTLEVPGHPPRRYRVTGSAVIDSRATRLVDDSDDSGLVLATCYPFAALFPGGPERYLVFAERVR